VASALDVTLPPTQPVLQILNDNKKLNLAIERNRMPVIYTRKEISRHKLPDSATLIDMLNAFILSKPELAPKSRKTMAGIIYDLLAFAGNRSPLHASTVEDWIASLRAEGLAESNLALHLNWVLALENWMYRRGYLERTSLHGVPKPARISAEARKNRMTDQEFEQAKAYFTEHRMQTARGKAY